MLKESSFFSSAGYSPTGMFTRPKLIAPFQRALGMAGTTRACASPLHSLEQAHQVLGVLLLLGEDLLHEPPRRRVLAAEVVHHLLVAVDGDALGDQVLRDHVGQRVALDVLGVAAGREALRREVGLAAELHDALRDLVGVLL